MPQFFFYNFIYLFLAALGLNCAWAFSGCNEWGLLSSYSVWASHHCGFSCCGAQAPGAQAQYLWGIWDLPIPGVETQDWLADSQPLEHQEFHKPLFLTTFEELGMPGFYTHVD